MADESSTEQEEYKQRAIKKEREAEETLEYEKGKGRGQLFTAGRKFGNASEEYTMARDYDNALRCALLAKDYDPQTDWSEIIREAEEGIRERDAKREGIVPLTSAFIFFIAGLFFLSLNITGNTIANLTINTSSFLGIGFLIISFIFGYTWIKTRQKN